MTDLNQLTAFFEDTLCEATEQFTGQEIYDALNEAIHKQIAWHQKELRSLQDFQFLMKGYRPGDLPDEL